MSERKEGAFGDREVMRKEMTEDIASQVPGCISEAVGRKGSVLDLQAQGGRAVSEDGTEGTGTSPRRWRGMCGLPHPKNL